MNEFIEKMKASGFEFTLFGSDRRSMYMLHIAHKKDKNIRALRHFEGPDVEILFANAVQYANNYDAYITNAAPCSK
jgi:hypothetical protein